MSRYLHTLAPLPQVGHGTVSRSVAGAPSVYPAPETR